MTTCKTGKVCIESYPIAAKARGRYCRGECGPVDVYKCEHCGKWHIGRRLHRTEHGRPKVREREEA